MKGNTPPSFGVMPERFTTGNGLQWRRIMADNRASQASRLGTTGGGEMNPLDNIIGTIVSGVILAVILTFIIKLIAGA